MKVIERNEKYLKAAVKAHGAERAAERAAVAVDEANAAKEELAWLAQAPVSDGNRGEGLPDQDAIDAAVAKRAASIQQAADKRAEKVAQRHAGRVIDV